MGARGFNQENTPVPWTGNSWSNIHAPNREDVAGCAFAISYKSNATQVKPSDFVVFSVVHDCIARQKQWFDVPNLPACPNGRCMCSWFWIHKSAGGSDQMYMTPFVCNVKNAKSDAKAVDVRNAQPPRKCYDPTSCTQGPRNPMYWKNEGSQNMPEAGHFAPTYSILYGFAEGAQHDIFTNTNPNNYTVRAPPAEKRCTDTKYNPKNLGSRISGSQSLKDGGDGIVSPNCQFSVWVEQGSGSIMFKDNFKNDVYLFIGTTRNQQPYTLKVLANGALVNTNSTGQVVWEAPMSRNSGKGPFRIDLNNLGQLVLSDGSGHNRWESNFFDDRENKFSSLTPDPAVWKNKKPDNGGNDNNNDNNNKDTVLKGIDLWGSDYTQATTPDASACQTLCKKDQRCKAWAFDTCGTTCWLKDPAPEPRDGGSCRTSGVVFH